MEVPFTQNGNVPNTPYQAGPTNAPSLVWKVTNLAPPSSSLLGFILLRTKNNGGLEEDQTMGGSRQKAIREEEQSGKGTARVEI